MPIVTSQPQFQQNNPEIEMVTSPTRELNRVLTSDTHNTGQLSSVPSFLIPRAPEDNRRTKGGGGGGAIRRVVERLFGRSASNANRNSRVGGDDGLDGQPLFESRFSLYSRKSKATLCEEKPEVLKQQQHPRYATSKPTSGTGIMGKTLAAIGFQTGRALIGRLYPGNHSTTANNDDHATSSSIPHYSLSLDELGGGLAAAPPTPNDASNPAGDDLETRITANHRTCIKHPRTMPPLSLAQLQVLIAEEQAEHIKISGERGSRLCLIPLDSTTAQSAFLSRSVPTRLGRNSRQLLIKSRVVSRNHCEISISDDDDDNLYQIIDVGSQMGTYVNGMRLSPAGALSAPRVLQSGDILQLGTDMDCDEDEQIGFRAVHFLVLQGHPLRSTAVAHKQQPTTNQEPSSSSSFGLLSKEKICKLHKRAIFSISGGEKSDITTALYIEFGDLLHENTHGVAILLRQGDNPGPCYAMRFNNYRLTWEAAVCEVRGDQTGGLLTAEATAGRDDHFAVYWQNQEGTRRRVAKVSIKPDRVVVSPISEQRPVQKGTTAVSATPTTATAITLKPPTLLLASRPASPYLSIGVSSNGRESPCLSPSLRSPLPILTTRLEETLVISRPEVPYYCITNGQVIARDRNNLAKERLIGEGRGVGLGGGAWGRRAFCWQGNLAVARDDQLLVLTLLLQQLHSNIGRQ